MGEKGWCLVGEAAVRSYVDGDASQPHKVGQLGKSDGLEGRDLTQGQEAEEHYIGLQGVLG